MDYFKVIFGIYFLLAGFSLNIRAKINDAPIKMDRANAPVKIEANHKDPAFIKAVEDGLKKVEKESPQVHRDALNVWKKFDSNSKTIHYTYRFWGRRLIACLKEEKKIVFDSEEKVGEVFKVLWTKGLISRNAVVVLMVDCWSRLVYLEGSPAWEKKIENPPSPDKKTPNVKLMPKSYEHSI